MLQSFFRLLMDGTGSFLPQGMPRHTNNEGETCHHYKVGHGIDEEEVLREFRELSWFLEDNDSIIKFGGLYGTMDDSSYVPVIVSKADMKNLMSDGWIEGRTSDAINRVFNIVSAHRMRSISRTVSKVRTLVFDSQFTLTCNQAHEFRLDLPRAVVEPDTGCAQQ